MAPVGIRLSPRKSETQSQDVRRGREGPRQRRGDRPAASVHDFINFVTGHEPSSSYARTLFCRLVKDGSEHANEIASNCSSFKIQGSRGSVTPCMTIRGLQRLLMILGGKVAAEFREIVEGVFTRYVAGDTSLIEEVRDNAAVQLRV